MTQTVAQRKALSQRPINAARQSSTDNLFTAPSHEGVGQGEIADAAPIYKMLREALAFLKDAQDAIARASEYENQNFPEKRKP